MWNKMEQDKNSLILYLGVLCKGLMKIDIQELNRINMLEIMIVQVAQEDFTGSICISW